MLLQVLGRNLVVVSGLALVLSACWGSRYDELKGRWQGEHQGQLIEAEFRPSEDTVILDGRPGTMHLQADHDGVLTLEMVGPDGRPGEAIITLLDEHRIRLEIPNTPVSVELTKVP